VGGLRDKGKGALVLRDQVVGPKGSGKDGVSLGPKEQEEQRVFLHGVKYFRGNKLVSLSFARKGSAQEKLGEVGKSLAQQSPYLQAWNRTQNQKNVHAP